MGVITYDSQAKSLSETQSPLPNTLNHMKRENDVKIMTNFVLAKYVRWPWALWTEHGVHFVSLLFRLPITFIAPNNPPANFVGSYVPILLFTY